MQSKNGTLLSVYGYDALNRLGFCALFGQSSTKRFYMKDRLATEIDSAVQRSIFQCVGAVHAQQWCSRHHFARH